tara:strand:+ start:673 stop:1227 length:555 start_codon:yes stop_codon:yes gene_type:complete
VIKKILTILFIGLLSIITNAFSDDVILNSLKEGKKLVFIRHAIAPGNGDPNNFNINNCSTQRNLDKNGIAQSKNIGLFFKNNKIKIDKVLSSEWCRCKDTAKYAFENFETFDALNSFYDERFAANETKQIKDLKNYIKNWDGDKNLILVTHFVVISSILNTGSSSGEIIISDENFNIIGSINTM